MRIIGGRNQRRHIKPPDGLPVRPTTDKAKEALFNILNNHFYFDEIRVLDLFAGTGSIAFEFASREATEVVAVENNPRCVRFIQQVMEQLNFDNLHVLGEDVFRFLQSCPAEYDIVFADPPYDHGHITEIPDLVFTNNIVSDNGWLILEHPADIHFEAHTHFLESRNYSKVHFSFFER